MRHLSNASVPSSRCTVPTRRPVRYCPLTRYTDRTERGMNLEWDGEGPEAKAVREYADDGSFDTRLEWDLIRRRTIVTDALGYQTLHHLDLLGTTYRITHPDGKDDWFHRDARKNILRHQHPDGSSDTYRWSEDDELLSHTSPDGGTTYYEYDNKGNLTGLQDPEGGIWKRAYDGKGNVVAGDRSVDPPDRIPVQQSQSAAGHHRHQGGKKTLVYNCKTYVGWLILMCKKIITKKKMKKRKKMINEFLCVLMFSLIRAIWAILFFLGVLNLIFSLWAYGVNHEINYIYKSFSSVFLMVFDVLVFIRFREFFTKHIITKE